jgi:hypothetical protein
MKVNVSAAEAPRHVGHPKMSVGACCFDITGIAITSHGPCGAHASVCLPACRVALQFLSLVSWGGVRLSPLGTATTIGLLYQPCMVYGEECGAVGGMRIGRGN